MKNFTISLCFLLTVSAVGFAQVPLTADYNGNDVTDQTINLKSDETMYLPITNNGSVSMNVTVEITAISVPHKAPVMSVCWQSCFTPSAPQSVGTRTIAAGENSGNDFDVLYSPDGNTNPANITFHIYEEENPTDYITLTLDTEVAGIKNTEKTSVSLFPNPATKFITVKIPEDLKNSELIVTNILGKTIALRQLKNTETTVNTETYSPGIYFVSIISENNIIETKKLIIKK
ncbi:MAG: T9SS type A sorting domain-containing protein [Bacteroidales bacterium]|nr:T9SS type A sorting domain-containing protein [Bacteroidales bacterium]